MTAHISRGVYKAGVQAYQDHADANQFHWVPAVIEVSPETIRDFKVDYWGISKKHLVGDGTRIWSSLGGIIAGRANATMTRAQEAKIRAEIKRVYGVAAPALLPLRVRSAVLTPVFAQNTLQVGAGGDVRFPAAFQFGSDFNYLIATGNSLFAEVVASQPTGDVAIANPAFGVNIDAKCEFRGEPWKVTIQAELSSFWREVRKSVSVSGKFGWFKLGKAEYNSLIVDLERKKIITIKFESGSLDLSKFGEQVFEMGKQIAEAVNQNGGQFSDFFKLEPNPDGSALADFMSFGGWSVSVNASYSERSFTQKFDFRTTLSYEGNFEASVPVSMPLALTCAGGNEKFFNDLDDAEPCITRAKGAALQRRLQIAKQKRDAMLADLLKRLTDGRITPEVYNLVKAQIDASVDEDSLRIAPSFLNEGVETPFSEMQAYTDVPLDFGAVSSVVGHR